MAIEYKRLQSLARTTPQFQAADPVLLDGEFCVADEGGSLPTVKIGDGVRKWSALPPLLSKAPDYVAGPTTTLPPGSPATVTIDNTVNPPSITFGIPAGQDGSGASAGHDTDIQYRQGAGFGGDDRFTWAAATGTLNVTNGQARFSGGAAVGPLVQITQTTGTNYNLMITGSLAGSLFGVAAQNTLAHAAAVTMGLLIGNDNQRTFILGKTSSVYSGSLFPGSPAGEICFIQSGGNVPISFVVGSGAGHETLGISATGAVRVAAPTAAGAATLALTMRASGIGASIDAAAGGNAIVITSGAVFNLCQSVTPAGLGYLSMFGAGSSLSLGANGGTDVTIAADHGVALGALASKGAGTINAAGVFINGIALAVMAAANPTASVALAAVAGVAATYMRSDAAPKLDLSIAPTWLGAHTFNAPAGANALTVNNISGSQGITVNQASGASYGINITGSQVGGMDGVAVNNLQAGATGMTLGLLVGNDGTRAFIVGKTSTTYSGSAFPGSPAGEISYIQSGGNVPISFVVGSGTGHETLGISATGTVSVAAPTSGVALTVNGVTGNAIFTGATPLTMRVGFAAANPTDFAGIDFSDTAIPKVRIAASFSGGGSVLSFGTSNNYTNGITNTALSIAATGAVTINPVPSGDALTLNGTMTSSIAAGTNSLTVSSTSATVGDGARVQVVSGSGTPPAVAFAMWAYGPQNTGSVVNGGPVGAQGCLRTLGAPGHPIVFGTGNKYRGQITDNGWQIAAPDSGIALQIWAAANAGSGATVQIFSTTIGDSVMISMGRNGAADGYIGISSANNVLLTGATAGDLCIRASTGISIGGGSTMAFHMANNGAARFSGALSMNNSTPYAGSAGWGVIAGTGVVAGYNGASATLLQTSTAMAAVLQMLKNFGMVLA